MKLILLFFGLLFSLSSFAQQRFVTLDSTKIWINTIGLENRTEGQPVLVFESGLGTPMGHWNRILEGAAQHAPVVSYDRPGIGESEANDVEPTIKIVSDRLIQLLQHLEVEPPYVLVGHSLGGLYVRGFANYYPETLAGLIIIDPADFTETQANKRAYYKPLDWSEQQIDDWLAQLEAKGAKRQEGAPPSIKAESKVLAEQRANDFAEIHTKPLPDIPVHMITGGRFDYPKHLRSKEFDEEIVFRTKMAHRVKRWTDVIQSVSKGMLLYSGDAGHFVHYDDPDLVVASIGIVLKDYELLKRKDSKK
ncbi:MAG: alpha/beta hydrolase [Saprospiraceae bacterium]